jgi:Xaa-Pro aminopeptidase
MPFDRYRLEARMQQDGIDAIIATSAHNTAYLLGGYRSHFFSQFRAIGASQYAAALAYLSGSPESAFYLGNPMEESQQEVEPIWVADVQDTIWTTAQLGIVAGQMIDSRGLNRATIGIELPFIQADTYLALRQSLPDATFVDCTAALEHLRAVKSTAELEMLASASDAIVDAMVATVRRARPGVTTRELAQRLADEESARGLHFDYCLAAVAPSTNRTPSSSVWDTGLALSLDSGGSTRGYIGDLARMAIIGDPTTLQVELLREVDAVQQAARRLIRAGVLGSEIVSSGENARNECAHGRMMEFVAHGMGLVSHEAPRLMSSGPDASAASHADLPLEAGMVLSIETTLIHPAVGFIKLEDTVAVTTSGWTALGDRARDWQVVA